MKEITIKLKTIADVNEFVKLTRDLTDSITAKQGRYCIDAKSIMGLFTLDLLNPITIETENEELISKITKWKV